MQANVRNDLHNFLALELNACLSNTFRIVMYRSIFLYDLMQAFHLLSITSVIKLTNLSIPRLKVKKNESAEQGGQHPL
jgi:hypothetical protein